MTQRIGRSFGQYGGVARAVERIGERWALLIVRDLLAGARRYSDLKTGLPRIPTNILSDRLRELHEAGIIQRVPTVRGGYELTPLGLALQPVIVELERWGWALLGDIGQDEIVTADSLTLTLHAAFRPAESRQLPATEYLLHIHNTSLSAIAANDTLDVIAVGPHALSSPRRRTEDTLTADLLELHLKPADLHTLLTGGSGPHTTDPQLLTRFQRTFRFDPKPDQHQKSAVAA